VYGVIHSPGYGGRVHSGQICPGAPVEIAHEMPPTAIPNGDCTMGYVAATKVTQVAIVKAKQYATAAVGVHNLNHGCRGGDVYGCAF
jgi:LDH2 family malate/lactate/ureidoglycolate dehydrogenase